MNLSMKWLNDYVKADIPIKDFVSGMTMSGSKVEGYKLEGGDIENVVVGRVISLDKHPGADSLYICKVDVNAENPLQIVTGATNVVPEAYVPVAIDGSTISGGKKINKGKLRGEVSEGMLCSLSELGLTKNDFPYADENGIFILEDDCDLTTGKDIREAIGLDDTVVEFEITSNRPDCLSVLGLARETSATFSLPFKMPEPSVKAGGDSVNELLSVTVKNPALCLRYAAAAVRNVKIAPSPRWIRERLRAAGVRPINNIVDITNYVMLEFGQPMHAFDLRHVGGNKIIVRNAAEAEEITTLDGTVRKLSAEMLVIADEKNPSAVAGVMGGEFSGVYDDTDTVIFESACFDGASVRMTSKKLGLRTESSSRFEKGLDPENCMPALLRACELVEALGVGEVADGFIDVYGGKKPETVIDLKPERINALLGENIPEKDMTEYLTRLGFKVENGKASVPSFRADVECDADLAEEVARLYGYDKIPTTALRGSSQGILTGEQKLTRRIEQTLLASGYNEIITYSFISPKYYDKIGLPQDSPLRDSVVISNPLGEDTSVMRTTAIPSMLETLARNYNNRNETVSFYEFATEYTPVAGEKLPLESKKIILGEYGEGCGFFEIKGAVERILERVGIADWGIKAINDDPAFHPGRCAEISIKGERLGVLGEVHPKVCENYDVAGKIYLAWIDFSVVANHSNAEKRYSPLPKFPASARDVALVCDEKLPVLAIQKEIASSVGGILEKLKLFDVYHGKQVGEGKKSVAFSLTLRASDRTLTDEECDNAVKRALASLKKIGAELRS